MSDQTFECKPSRIFVVGFFVFWAMTSLIILSIDCNFLIKLILFFIALLYSLKVFWRYGFLREKKSIIVIRKIDQKWIIKMKNGEECEATLLGESWVNRMACLLLFRTTSSFFTQVCLILPDSLPLPLYRKLRLIVKMYG